MSAAFQTTADVTLCLRFKLPSTLFQQKRTKRSYSISELILVQDRIENSRTPSLLVQLTFPCRECSTQQHRPESDCNLTYRSQPVPHRWLTVFPKFCRVSGISGCIDTERQATKRFMGPQIAVLDEPAAGDFADRVEIAE